MVSKAYSSKLPALGTFSKALVYLNAALFSILLIPWLLRWIKYRNEPLLRNDAHSDDDSGR
ncbi:hypothetical protein [Thermococcus sp. 2319x1]|uniref:hypothetical protein n=1 Tax=Thermococcus sp. 2319x1 TaxID=1674923 RepID=UPI00351A5E3C